MLFKFTTVFCNIYFMYLGKIRNKQQCTSGLKIFYTVLFIKFIHPVKENELLNPYPANTESY